MAVCKHFIWCKSGMLSDIVYSFGSVAGNSWTVFDLRQGSQPISRGDAFGSAVTGNGFLWSPLNPRQFAIFSSHPKAEPAIKIVHTSFPGQPRQVTFSGSSRTVGDIAWHPTFEILVAALGNSVVFVQGQM